MITEQDLQNAIAECQGERNPNANTCIKLAAYLTIYEHLYPQEDKSIQEIKTPVFEAVNNEKIGNYGNSEFMQVIAGKDTGDVMAVVDELMDSLKVINPRLYDGVIHQLS